MPSRRSRSRWFPQVTKKAADGPQGERVGVEEVLGSGLVIVSLLASLPAMLSAMLLYGQPVTTPLPKPAPAKGTALPWVELTARPWIMRMSGDVVAREAGAPSAMVGPLRFREDLGLSGADLFYEGTLTIYVTPHNMLVADVLLGSASGRAQLTSDTPFDDVTFTAGQRAHADVSLRTWGLGYRRRLWTTTVQAIPVRLDVGIGFRGIGSSTKIRTASAADSEDIFAAVVPYLEVGGRSRSCRG